MAENTGRSQKTRFPKEKAGFWTPEAGLLAPKSCRNRANAPEIPRAEPQNCRLAVSGRPQKLIPSLLPPKCAVPHPQTARGPKKCPVSIWADPPPENGSKTGPKQAKTGLFGGQKGPLGPPPTAEGAKNEVFGKKSKMTHGNPLRKVPNSDAVPLVGAHEERYPFAKNYFCWSLF